MRDFRNRDIAFYDGLAAEPRLGREPRGEVQTIGFVFILLAQVSVATLHDDVAGGASAHASAGMV